MLMRQYSLPTAFSIPYASIDAEHGQLIASLNQLAMELAARAPVQLASSVDRFLRSLQEHFRSDQLRMQQAGYPRLEEHRARQQQCCRAVASVLTTAVERNELDDEILDDVFTILLDIVARLDLTFRDFLATTGRLHEVRPICAASWPLPQA
jgi:hemerythrin-like metal-binding protein